MGNLCATFNLFNLSHFVYLFLSIAIIVSLVFIFRKINDFHKKYVGITLVCFAVLFVLIDFISKIKVMDNVFENLPINTLHVFVYVMIFLECTKNTSWTKFAFFIIFPITIYSMLFVPNVYTNFGSTSITLISYFLLSALIISYSLLRLIWSEEYLEKKDILNSTMNFGILISGAHIINVVFRFTVLGVDCNYMGTMGENYDTIIGLVEKIIPIPFVNIIPLIAILVGVEFLLKLPFDIVRTKRDGRAQLEELVALGNLKAQAQYRKNKSGSQILIRSEHKAQPTEQKKSTNVIHKDGFVSINKEVEVNKEKNNK